MCPCFPLSLSLSVCLCVCAPICLSPRLPPTMTNTNAPRNSRCGEEGDERHPSAPRTLNEFWCVVFIGDRFFRVDESFRASTRAGLTRARSLNTWVYSERNAVTHLPGLLPSYRVSCEQESVDSKNQEKKEKAESRKTSVRKNTPYSVLRSQNALKTPRLSPLKC